MSQAPKRIRKQYVNSDYPLVLLRFEDGHEIKVYKGTGKEFDAYPGGPSRCWRCTDPTLARPRARRLAPGRRFRDAAE
jgi:hypothetical protein